MGATRKRSSGRWEARWYDEANVQHSKTGFPTKKAATAFIRDKEGAKVRGETADPTRGRVPFRQVAEDWYESTTHLKPSTRKGYRQILDAYLVPEFGDTPIGKINRARVRRFINNLTGVQKGSAVSPTTKKNILRTLSPVFSYAVDELEIIPANPCIGRKRWKHLKAKQDQTEMLYLTPQQIAALAAEVGEEWSTLIYTAGFTGVRSGELGALRIRHLDLLRRRITVAESLTDVSGQLHFGTTKNDKVRSFGTPAFLADMLAAHLVGRGEDRNALVFTSEKGRPLRHSNWSARVFKPALERLVARKEFPVELAKLRFHDLRHSHAAICISEGMHPKAIAERLGHSSISITMDRYGHLYNDHDDKAMASLDRAYERGFRREEEPQGNVVPLP